MKTLNDCVQEYKKMLKYSDIKTAYHGIMKFMMDLRNHFENKYPDFNVSGSMYTGFMDFTYFTLSPESFKHKKLRIVIIFIHEKLRFEVWLTGYNKKIQEKYWRLCKEHSWSEYRIPTSLKKTSSILEYILSYDPDFDNLKALTEKIDLGTMKFIKDVEAFLNG